MMFSKNSVSQSMIDAVNTVLEKEEISVAPVYLKTDKNQPQQILSERADREDDEHGGGPTPHQNPDKGWKPRKVSMKPAIKSESSPFDWKGKPSELKKKPGETAGFDSKKISTGTVYSRKPVKDTDPVKKEETSRKNENLKFKDFASSLLEKTNPNDRYTDTLKGREKGGPADVSGGKNTTLSDGSKDMHDGNQNISYKVSFGDSGHRKENNRVSKSVKDRKDLIGFNNVVATQREDVSISPLKRIKDVTKTAFKKMKKETLNEPNE